ncbi:MAG: histidinol dehydrogenase [Gammaproteobacteria bacterium]|nr:histidinol dehydrogenase [Gammaproteobacteria bacterium]
MLTVINGADPDFERHLARLLERGGREQERAVNAAVADIIAAVRERGDAALLELTARFDQRDITDPAQLQVPREAVDAAVDSLDAEVADALRAAAGRITRYHEREARQSAASWQFEEADGTRLGQHITALERVGVYVPGGQAAYPSSVLMTVIPAKVAGVFEVIMTVPAPRGEVGGAVLAAAALAGVDRVFTIGGAQAIAALAYSTETVPAVDKIVGPGNRYVAEAKRQVFGQVGIDMLAGPSEVVVICDRHADSDWVAMDLFAQAEHDQHAQSIAITDSEAMAARIGRSVSKLLPQMARRDIIERALADHGAIIKVADLRTAVALANRIAPEHLELMVAQPQRLVGEVRHAGAVFAGAHSAEALGDYCAGPNHVLPTAGAARFSSPLGVCDFQKRSSVIQASRQGAAEMARIASVLARCEGLDAHARAAEYRLPGQPGSK